jgi:hypothetical protein
MSRGRKGVPKSPEHRAAISKGLKVWASKRPRDFFRQVKKTPTCWIWKGVVLNGGYGQIKVKGKKFTAHRFFYELLVAPVPEGLTLDHLCRVRTCVNPVHLEPVTGRVNTLRGNNPCAQNARKTHCKQGHPLSGTNLYLKPSGARICLTCRRAEYHRNKRTQRGVLRDRFPHKVVEGISTLH